MRCARHEVEGPGGRRAAPGVLPHRLRPVERHAGFWSRQRLGKRSRSAVDRAEDLGQRGAGGGGPAGQEPSRARVRQERVPPYIHNGQDHEYYPDYLVL